MRLALPAVITACALVGTVEEGAAQRRDRRTIAVDSGTALYWEGYIHYQRSDRESVLRALSLWDAASNYFLDAGMDRELAAVFRAMAVCHHALGDVETARLYNARADSSAVLVRFARARVGAQSGWGLGVSVGVGDLAGGADGAVGTGGSVEVTSRRAWSSGWQLHFGGRYERHGISGVRQVYQVFGLHVEPRFMFSQVSAVFSPFVGLRAGFAWENVTEVGAVFRGSGLTLGGTGGGHLRLNRQTVLEGGMGLGVIRFGDFTFDGATIWESCVGRHRAAGDPLPVTVQQCGASVNTALPLLTLEGGISGSGPRYQLAHPGSARLALWTRFWLGLNISIGVI